MTEVRAQIIEEIRETFAIEGVTYDDSMLDKGVMELGVDSLTYAVLVTRLQVKLGRDPFTENPELGYPRVLGDFVNAYLN
jgi:acyl carrier protein